MAGIGTALNLRELPERTHSAPIECLFHHFCETALRPTFDDPDFHNDFAVWAGRNLRDRVLAERLAVINPYKLESFEELRIYVIDILEERLSELQFIPWVPSDQQFQFMQAVTVVFDTGVELSEPTDLGRQIPNMSLGSIYYHFVEARRRTETRIDDFSTWLLEWEPETESLIKSLANIDFYFMTLSELKNSLVDAVVASNMGDDHG
jgi:hypothetical protein